MILNTNLPAFHGYYSSIFDDVDTSCELDYINEIRIEKGLPEIENDDLIEWDYKTYYSELNLQLCKCVEYFLIELDLINSIYFVALESPKYYNFSNDVIECKIDVKPKNIRKYINNNLENFENYLIENHKSRSGFISFYDWDLNLWLDRMKNFKQLDHIEIHSILNFVCENEGFVLENEIYNGNFDYIGLYSSNFEQLTNE